MHKESKVLDPRETTAARDLQSDDWVAVAGLLGRDASYGERLASHVGATYRPSFGWVVPSSDPLRVDAAIVAGVRRRASDGSVGSVSIAWVGVHPTRRRIGIGRQLIERVALGASRLGARRLEATVDVGDTNAVGFFSGVGFEVERRTAEIRVAGTDARELERATAPLDVTIRPLRHEELPSLTGLLIHLAVERATEPHDDLDGLTPSVLLSASMHVDHVAVCAWEARDHASPVGVAWGSRRADGVHVHFVGVHEDARRRGTGRALVGALLAASKRPALLARMHEPVALHGFLVRIGAVVSSESVALARPIRQAGDATIAT